MHPTATVDAYIAAQPESVRPLLESLRAIARQAAPLAEERVSYGIPTLWQGGNLFHFGAAKAHIGLYPGPAAIAAFASELVGYKTSRGTIQVPFDRPLPPDLIVQLVQFNLRVAQEHAKARRSPSGKAPRAAVASFAYPSSSSGGGSNA
jgi:uncharacterized protein YdhG (YjbR/CyaY superfamily)